MNTLRNERDYSTTTHGRGSWPGHIIYSLGPAWRLLLCFRLRSHLWSTLVADIVAVDGGSSSEHL